MTLEAFAQGWVNFLQELAMARAYPAVYQVAGSAVGRNEVLETLLPSQFYIRVASLADEGLAVVLEAHALTCTHLNAKGKPDHAQPADREPSRRGWVGRAAKCRRGRFRVGGTIATGRCAR